MKIQQIEFLRDVNKTNRLYDHNNVFNNVILYSL